MIMRNCRILLVLGFVVWALNPGVAPAQDRPLVSTINGSLGGFAGWSRLPSASQSRYWGGFVGGIEVPPFVCDPSIACYVRNSGHGRSEGLTAGAEARLSIPVGQRFGLQADGTAGVLAGLSNGNFRGHVFAGHPAYGTLGALLQMSTLGGADFKRAGGEGQFWLGPLSLYASAGYQWANATRDIAVEDGFFVCGEARWYVMDNALIGIGGDWTRDRAAGFANVEAQLGSSGNFGPVSLFAQGGIGENRFRSAIAGARWNFGPGPSLKARHRQDLLLPYAACGLQQFRTIRTRNSVVAIE